MEETANRLYKDTVFRDLFGSEERKDNALSLYNALAGTHYEDPNDLELTTLDDVIYLNVKNDVSFLVGEEMVLWEHQSSDNPNMPLRGLIYFGRLYSRYVETHDLNIYGSKPVKLPTPRFVVFYNGVEKHEQLEHLQLSDSFSGEGDVEVNVTVVNINAESGADVLDGCETLAAYSVLVQRIRANAQHMELSEAVDDAVASCIEDGILSRYLRDKRAEVKDMFMTEYDEEKVHRWYREEGIEEGRQETLLAAIKNLVDKMHMKPDEAMEVLDVPEGDRAKYRELLGTG